jgi:UDP-GlcNAc3NAcA epimerase
VTSARQLRIVSIAGTRPQFIKAAVMSRAIRARHDEILVHTGQHYDPELSAVFFDEMAMPEPVRLHAGSGTHARQTAAMLTGIEDLLLAERPEWVVAFGDTNSTLAGALAAAKIGVPVAHVEAGLRSFNRGMAEETNRVLVDHIAALHFCPSETAMTNLANEGIRDSAHLVGDVMGEALALAIPRARASSRALERFGVEEGAYVLATVHRAENTDDPRRLGAIVEALNALADPVVLPLHPRTRRAIDAAGWTFAPHVRVSGPVGYLDMVRLLASARVVATDSGGLQKEAYWARVPCVTLRDETEWVETVACGWNRLAGADRDGIVDAIQSAVPLEAHPPLYGAPGAAAAGVEIIEQASAREVGVVARGLGTAAR